MDTIIEKFYKLTLKKNSPIPLYFQIEEFVRKMIENEDLKPGDKIPTESELMNIFNVSRTTIRKLSSNLLIDNLIEIKRGQGTFIKIKEFYEPIFGIISFTEEALKQGFTPSTKILDLNIIKLNSDEEITKMLKLKKNLKVYKLKRLRFLNGNPAGIDNTYLPINFVPDLKKMDFEEYGVKQSLYYLLEHKYKLELEQAEEIITPILVTKKDAKLLGLKPNTPVLYRHRLIILPNKTPLLAMNSIYAYSFKTSLKGRKYL